MPDIKVWDPNNPAEWNKRLAWTTVWLSTFSLTFGFCAWFLVPSLAPRLNEIGFSLDHRQLYWLVAMVGLSAGTLRIFWTFLPPIVGTRFLVTFSTFLLLIPFFCWIYAVMNVDTPFWLLLFFSLLSGIGGGTFSGLMASTNYYFPKSEKGFALGVQGGLSDFGTGLVQFVTPLVIGFSFFGILGAPQILHMPDGKTSDVWLQNAAWVWIPLVLIVAILSWICLRSVPVKSHFKQQLTIFSNKHTWFMTLFYYGTFATFAGLGAQLALLGQRTFADIPGAPSAVALAWLGPVIGALSRVLAGGVADKIRGGRVTSIMSVCCIAGLLGLWFYKPTTVEGAWIWLMIMFWIFFWTGVGNASTTEQMAVLFPPIQGGAVVGWTSAIGAYGPFTIGALLAQTNPATMFAVTTAIFIAILIINIYYYDRKGAPDLC
ncbi:MAG: MFS transporter [Burkholderiales bacterium]|nr:MFS transporter [Burkholderiales bacterium]